jgi:hypothetical protein
MEERTMEAQPINSAALERIRDVSDAAIDAETAYPATEFDAEAYKWFARVASGGETSIAEAAVHVDKTRRQVPAFPASGAKPQAIGIYHAANAVYYLALSMHAILSTYAEVCAAGADLYLPPEKSLTLRFGLQTRAARAYIALAKASADAALAHAPQRGR